MSAPSRKSGPWGLMAEFEKPADLDAVDALLSGGTGSRPVEA